MRYPWITRVPIPALLLLATAMAMSCGRTQVASDARTQYDVLRSAVETSAMTDSRVRLEDDGGTSVQGRLNGLQVVIRFPRNWNRQAALFAHGYTTPGSSTQIPNDPLEKDADALQLVSRIYHEQFAVAASAYSKSGLGADSGIEATLELKNLLDHLGATRAYAIGVSMGGNIVTGLIELYPEAFAGGFAACGVVDGWESEVGYLVNVRASYNYFARKTPYQLPGDDTLSRSMLSPMPPAILGLTAPLYRIIQMRRIAKPILKLFAAASAKPGGSAAKIIQNVASAAHIQPEISSFLDPLITAGLGMDDMNATYKGVFYDNSTVTYHASELSEAENAAFNRNVQRVHAEPQAVAYARQWHQSTGHFKVPLVTLHNTVDPLVPFSQEEGLRSVTDRSGNISRLKQISVPPMTTSIPITGVSGLTHCGFTPEQIASGWEDLRRWAETGAQP